MILYKNKYLKYKNKYLDLKKIFGGANIDVQKQRIEKWATQFRNLNFNIVFDIDDKIGKKGKYNISNLTISRGGSDPLPESIIQILESLGEFNITGNLILSNNKIIKLPTKFCNIIIGGHLYLDNNNLTKLPFNFKNIKIGGSLYLNNNKLKRIFSLFFSSGINGEYNIKGGIDLTYNYIKTLPYCEDIKIGGDLNLQWNFLETLPDSFINISVRGDLGLAHNKLETLPEGFGNIKIGGSLILSYNLLKELPYFTNIQVGNSLYLQNNQIEQLPRIFNININNEHNLPLFLFNEINVSGNLYLQNNKLKTLPESFGNIKIHGDLNLSHNELKHLPRINTFTVDGEFNLSMNRLNKMPEYFEEFHVGDLNLAENNLMELPYNFVNIQVTRNLNLSNNLLKILPPNFGEIHVGGDLNLSYNLLKILPTNFEHVGNKILLNNNYIISSPPHNCERRMIQKNYCHLDNQTIEGLYNKENKKCSECQEIKNCKKCAICKDKYVWYCSKECEIKDWCNPRLLAHRKICNNIINTTFIISAHGELKHYEKPIENMENMSIITLSLIGTPSYFSLDPPLINIYTNNNSLFNNDDKTLTLTESGKKISEDYLDIKLINRLDYKNKHFNNISLQFYDTYNKDLAKLIRIHCFKKHENQHIEISDNYLYDYFNHKQFNSVDVINHIVENERNFKNNRGHITFIVGACRGFPETLNQNIDDEIQLMRAKSLITEKNTHNVLESDDTIIRDTEKEKQRESNAQEKHSKEKLEKKIASNGEEQFKRSIELVEEIKRRD